MKIVPWQLAVGDYEVRWSSFVRVYSNLYTYKASKCKHTIIRLHHATSKFAPWNMGYVVPLNAYASIVQIYPYVMPPCIKLCTSYAT